MILSVATITPENVREWVDFDNFVHMQVIDLSEGIQNLLSNNSPITIATELIHAEERAKVLDIIKDTVTVLPKILVVLELGARAETLEKVTRLNPREGLYWHMPHEDFIAITREIFQIVCQLTSDHPLLNLTDQTQLGILNSGMVWANRTDDWPLSERKRLAHELTFDHREFYLTVLELLKKNLDVWARCEKLLNPN